MTDDFTPLGYITLEQAVDAVGRYLIPTNGWVRRSAC